MRAGVIDEMMADAIDGAVDSEDTEAETEEEVDKVGASFRVQLVPFEPITLLQVDECMPKRTDLASTMWVWHQLMAPSLARRHGLSLSRTATCWRLVLTGRSARTVHTAKRADCIHGWTALATALVVAAGPHGACRRDDGADDCGAKADTNGSGSRRGAW